LEESTPTFFIAELKTISWTAFVIISHRALCAFHTQNEIISEKAKYAIVNSNYDERN